MKPSVAIRYPYCIFALFYGIMCIEYTCQKSGRTLPTPDQQLHSARMADDRVDLLFSKEIVT